MASLSNLSRVETIVTMAVMQGDWPAPEDRKVIHQTFVDAKEHEKTTTEPVCERCRNHDESCAVHDYWPKYSTCGRCVRVLLEVKWPPFILRPGTEDDYYICSSEQEWHEIKQGLKSIPEHDTECINGAK